MPTLSPSQRQTGASIDILWVPLVWAAFNRRELTPLHRDVLLRLPKFRGKGGLIFPSHETLAQRARCSVSTVKRALEIGRTLGLIDWKGVWRRSWNWATRRCSNLYSILWAPAPNAENPAKFDIAQEDLVALRQKKFLYLTVETGSPRSDPMADRASLAEIARRRTEKIAQEWLGRGRGTGQGPVV